LAQNDRVWPKAARLLSVLKAEKRTFGAAQARAAAEDGFSGKFWIHPDQIDPVRRAIAPGPERIAWARAVRDAFAASPEADVLTLDGRMIEAMHLRLARKILAQADGDCDPA
jgi:citrate lyase subunit beta/citryl-CoA lyase